MNCDKSSLVSKFVSFGLNVRDYGLELFIKNNCLNHSYVYQAVSHCEPTLNIERSEHLNNTALFWFIYLALAQYK
jgi:hypothetical protein